jgi:hypothetical protein
MLMNVGYILDACDEVGKYYFAQVIAVNRARDEITVWFVLWILPLFGLFSPFADSL